MPHRVSSQITIIKHVKVSINLCAHLECTHLACTHIRPARIPGLRVRLTCIYTWPICIRGMCYILYNIINFSFVHTKSTCPLGMYVHTKSTCPPGMYVHTRSTCPPGMYVHTKSTCPPGMYLHIKSTCPPGMYVHTWLACTHGLYLRHTIYKVNTNSHTFSVTSIETKSVLWNFMKMG